MIIFDLDTLADCEHRRHLVEIPLIWEPNEGPFIPMSHNVNCDKWRNFQPNWTAFYEACDKDKPIKPVVDMFHNLHAQEKHVQIWTGRCESVRDKTYQWLLDNIDLKYITRFCGDSDLKMRPIGDNTPLHELKERWVNEYLSLPTMDFGEHGILPKIDFVFDSDQKSIEMWRRRGVFVFDCNQGET